MREPLLIIDSSHNLPGMETLSAEMDELGGGGPLDIVLGVMKDKGWEPMVDRLLPFARRFIIVEADVERSMPAPELELGVKERIGMAGTGEGPRLAQAPEVICSPDVGGAMRRILEDREGRYLVTGSTYLAGEVMSHLLSMGVMDRSELGLPVQADPLLQ
jgi:folylpolyglutamate synthase/dihydropteroate synthase